MRGLKIGCLGMFLQMFVSISCTQKKVDTSDYDYVNDSLDVYYSLPSGVVFQDVIHINRFVHGMSQAEPAFAKECLKFCLRPMIQLTYGIKRF